MSKQKELESAASEKFKIIAPLLDESLDRGKFIGLKKEIALKQGLSERSVGRYYAAYKESGFEGLKPSPRQKTTSKLPDNYPEIVSAAITLRKESAHRSVRDIIKVLELEGVVSPGSLSRSTLQRHLQEAGFGSKQYKKYTTKGTTARRFQKQHRCVMWQGDIKYGPHLPVGPKGKMTQIYLVVWIDDFSRFIICAKFYDNQRVEIIEDSLRDAVMKYGIPESVYLDNGSQYRSEWLKTACAKIGVKLIFTKPFSPEAKGKVEAFNRRVDSFLSEASLTGAKTLKEYNELLDVWITEYYHKTPHSGTGGISPETAFKSDTRPLRFVEAQKLRDAFLHSEEREVDKTGCISLQGRSYEVGLSLMGRKVEVLFDPSWFDEVEIRHKDFKPFMAKEVTIGEFCGARRELPQDMKPTEPQSSRLLDGLKKNSHDKRTDSRIATAFRQIWEEESNHV
jgi:transposase InsO family protein